MKELILTLENANYVLQDYNFLEDMPRIFPETKDYFIVNLYLEKLKEKDRYIVKVGLKYTDGRIDELPFTEFAERMQFVFYAEDYVTGEPSSPENN
ncbi:MAG: hypothetical protein H7Y00_15640 [Fimbriimonadaceae bacterium]|nr:hypothetical protein [Chitinophagales bacterium]